MELLSFFVGGRGKKRRSVDIWYYSGTSIMVKVFVTALVADLSEIYCCSALVVRDQDAQNISNSDEKPPSDATDNFFL